MKNYTLNLFNLQVINEKQWIVEGATQINWKLHINFFNLQVINKKVNSGRSPTN